MHRLTLLCSAVLLTASTSRAAAQHDQHPRADSGFAALQKRGKAAMGVDQYTSTHAFEPLADGGRITLERDEADSAGTAQIRAHMREIARAFAAGRFETPRQVHQREVPGAAVMAERREAITYTVRELPRGAELRITSADPVAVAAIHEFLAFQRADHRVGDPASKHQHQRD